MHIYHTRWNELSEEHIQNLFDKYLGKGVTAFPFTVLPDLRKLEIATLEVVENRTESTIYRIRETGAIYYNPARKNDRILKSYPVSPLVYVIGEVDGRSVIERLKSPKFRAFFDPFTKELSEVEWLEQAKTENKAASVVKNAVGFLGSRVK